MEPLIIHIFDEETQNYEYDDLENSWFIVKHGNGKVDIINIDEKTKIENVSRWKLRHQNKIERRETK